MKDLGYDFDHAADRVLLRYLSHGDARPLLDLLWRGKTPGSDVLRYLAAMIDPEFRTRLPNGPLLYEIHFEERRKRGRPISRKSGIHLPDYRAILKPDTTAMAEGRQPNDSFWIFLRCCLSATLDPIQFRKAFGKDIPVRAKLVRTDGRKGRNRDPELETRDKGLAWFVQERIRRGDGYESAIRGTLEMISKTAKAERWPGKIGEKTIRNAYDTGGKGKASK